jgi:DNA-directed RNA polymerase
MHQLIDPTKTNAKDFVLERLTSEHEKEVVASMGQYTLEAIIVYVVSLLYSSESSMVRVSTLIDHLDRQVRSHSLISMLRSLQKKQKPKIEMKEVGSNVVLGVHYPIGVALMDFIVDRKMMSIQLIDDRKSDVPIQKKKGKYYIPKLLYAIYNYDISLLPLKLNLPMVCKPVQWQSACGPFTTPKDMSDLKGGYLTGLGESARYKLLSSGNVNNYFIMLDDDYQQLCDVMNTLQEEPFEINKHMLGVLKTHHQSLVNTGLLMPKALCNANMKKLGESLRNAYMNNDKGIRSIYTYSDVLSILHKDVQRALFEDRVLLISDALEGFQLYFPVFLDFRGRIYRSGLMHFHERDIVRSLILFSRKNDPINDGMLQRIEEATAFYYKSFHNYRSACEWYSKELPEWSNFNEEEFFRMVSRAKKPFQYLSTIPVAREEEYYKCVPITQDASSSAYQIMSFLLLDRTMAINTNLISVNGVDKIFDIYTTMQENLIKYVDSFPEEYIDGDKMEVSPELKRVVREHFDRKLVKSIFMPLIYGKTLNSTANDLRNALPKWLTKNDSFTLAELCFDFWRENYSNMNCLINLIKNIGWLVSFRGDHVIYHNNLFRTIQKYTKQESVNAWIFDKVNKKRRQVTLRVSTDKNDRRKSEISTFVNFIHQLDAYISMKMIAVARQFGFPIYTVHDNFITTANYSDGLANIYRKVFVYEDPLAIINRYIYNNLVEPLGSLEEFTPSEKKFYLYWLENKGDIDSIIPLNMLNKYLKRNKPHDLKKKKDIEIWEKRINTIFVSYKMYIRYICQLNSGEKTYPWDLNSDEYHECMERYKANYRNFREEMDCGEINYSLHY